MARIYVSGLVNTETAVKVSGFPIPYYPIDYPFFGVNTAVSGVGYNLAKALKTLGDEVLLASYLGKDIQGEVIRSQLAQDGISRDLLLEELPQTPASVVLYEPSGRRQIYCDLKDVQDRRYPASRETVAGCDIVVACNIGFNRELVAIAREMGKCIATDVHVLSDVEDDYNRDFMEAASILFLSDEDLPCAPEEFLMALSRRYHNDILVMGRGDKGAMMYVRAEDRLHDLPCVPQKHVVNTVGAGDALFSGFLHFYAKGMFPEAALHCAQIFASAKIGVSGAAQGFLTEKQVLERR